MPRKTLRIPLATEFLNRDATLTKDSRLINCYVEKYYDGRTAIVKRPGLSSSQELGTQLGQGIISHLDSLVTVAGNTVYNSKLVGGSQSISTNNEVVYFEKLSLPLDQFTPSAPNVSPNAALPPVTTDPLSATLSSSSSSRISIDKLPVNTTAIDGLSVSVTSKDYLIIKGNRAAYYWNGYDNKVTQITDNNYPRFTVAGIVQLDGYIFVMDQDGVIYNSNLQDHTKWNSLDFIQAEVEPDGGVAIVKHLNYLIAFGKWSMEFFYDAANPLGSPLARIDNAFAPIGCANGNSVVAMDTSVIWVSQTKEDNGKAGRGREVMMLSGMSPKKISTPFIERILANDSLTTVRAMSLKNNGHDFYILTLVDSSITLVYDITANLWVQWTGINDFSFFLSESCTIGKTNNVTLLEESNIPINGLDLGLYFQMPLVDGKYLVTTQTNDIFSIYDGNTTAFIYDTNIQLKWTIPITGRYDNYVPVNINQIYNNGKAYFTDSPNNILIIDIYAKTVQVIPITISGKVISSLSTVNFSGTYITADVVNVDNSVSVYLVNILTGVSTLLTTIAAADDVIAHSFTVRTFIYGNYVHIPAKSGSNLVFYRYSITTNLLVDTKIISSSTASTLINVDVQNGFFSFKDGVTGKITVSYLSTIVTTIATGIPYGTNPTSVLVDQIYQYVNVYDNISMYTYTYTGTLVNTIATLISFSDTPIHVSYILKSESFFSPVFHTNLTGTDYVLDYNSGRVSTISELYYSDSANVMNVHVITPNIDIGTSQRKFTSELEVIGDKVAGTLQVSYSKDDYTSWIPYRNITLSNDRAKIHRLGKYRRSAFEFYYTGSTPLRLEAFDLTIDGGED